MPRPEHRVGIGRIVEGNRLARSNRPLGLANRCGSPPGSIRTCPGRLARARSFGTRPTSQKQRTRHPGERTRGKDHRVTGRVPRTPDGDPAPRHVNGQRRSAVGRRPVFPCPALTDGHQLHASTDPTCSPVRRRSRWPRGDPSAGKENRPGPRRCGLKQTSWLSGLAAVRSPRRAASVRTWTLVSSPTGSTTRSSWLCPSIEKHVGLVLGRIHPRKSRWATPGSPGATRAWCPVTNASNPRRRARASSRSNLMCRLHSMHGLGERPATWDAT